MSSTTMKKEDESQNLQVDWDVVVVGAGPAGIGCAYTCQHHFDIKKLTILERHEIGASFKRWPKETRFITPSFNANSYGCMDLNSVGLSLSPDNYLRIEHPNGEEFAEFLNATAEYLKLPVQEGVDVISVEKKDGIFHLHTSQDIITSRFVIWAAGEFQYPTLDGFPGAELCLHSSLVKSWKELQGDEFVVIGGFESGADAAFHLVSNGKRVTVYDGGDACSCDEEDPSSSLSSYTRDRLRSLTEDDELDYIQARVVKVEKTETGFTITDDNDETITTANVPILATGFDTSLTLIKDLFSWEEDTLVLSENDESTKTPGLFLAGPFVEHKEAVFCFIYKFRQRFGVVANAIANSLGLDSSEIVAEYRSKSMYVDDLSTITVGCHGC